jgi:hypothetical protein
MTEESATSPKPQWAAMTGGFAQPVWPGCIQAGTCHCCMMLLARLALLPLLLCCHTPDKLPAAATVPAAVPRCIASTPVRVCAEFQCPALPPVTHKDGSQRLLVRDLAGTIEAHHGVGEIGCSTMQGGSSTGWQEVTSGKGH